MSVTVQNTAAVPTDKCASFGSACVTRPMAPEYVGTWTELWFGFRFRLNPVYLNTGLFRTETLLGFGLCVGDSAWNQDISSGASSAKVTPVHTLGIHGPEPSSVNLTLSQTSGKWYASGAWFWKNVVNGVETTATGYTAQCSADPSARTLMIGRIVRGSPNWTLETFYPDVPSSVVDVPDNLFATMLSQATWADMLTLKPTGYGTSFPTSITLPVDTAANGEFDSVFCSWNKTFSTVDISEFAVSVFPKRLVFTCVSS